MGESNPNYASGEFNFNELSGFDGKHSLLNLLVVLIIVCFVTLDLLTNCENELLKNDLFTNENLLLDEELPVGDIPFDLLDSSFLEAESLLSSASPELYSPPQQVLHHDVLFYHLDVVLLR